MEINNLIFNDFETGGLKSYINGVCSCAIQYDTSDILELWFKPQKMVYDYQAFKVNGLSLEALEIQGGNRAKILNILEDIGSNATYITLCGWNVGFDIEFLLKIYKDYKQNLPCPFQMLDLMEIAKQNIPKQDLRKKDNYGIENFKLSTVYQYFFDDFEEEKAHTASYDVWMCQKLFNEFNERNWV